MNQSLMMAGDSPQPHHEDDENGDTKPHRNSSNSYNSPSNHAPVIQNSMPKNTSPLETTLAAIQTEIPAASLSTKIDAIYMTQPTNMAHPAHAIDRAVNAADTNAVQSFPNEKREESEKHPRINKNDAMVYLEQVRSQFADQPEIYGKFLDIMKEFKAHAITTELVIERVTTLFRGYPHLIEGFNAFIPEEHRTRLASYQKKNSRPSYVMQPPSSLRTGLTKYLSAGPSPPSTVSEYEQQRSTAPATYLYPPAGYAQQHYGPAPHHHPPPPHYHYSNASQNWNTPSTASAAGPSMAPTYLHHPHHTPIHHHEKNVYEGTLSQKTPLYVSERAYHHMHHPTSIPHHHMPSAQQSYPQTNPSYASANTQTPATAPTSYATAAYPQTAEKNISHALPPPEKGERERKSSMGMLQAVGYLKKIQDRFFGHPEIYQSFVEVLRSYQREQRSIRDVYAQVAGLFAGHPDLLEEFSQFVPDAASLPKNALRKGGTYVPMPGAEGRPTRRSSVGPSVAAPSTVLDGKRTRIGPLLNAPVPLQPTPPDIASLPEGDFFVNVREFLGIEGGAYGEFVKCLEFYTHRIVAKHELLDMVRPFLQRAPSLLARFAHMLRITDTHRNEEDHGVEVLAERAAERRFGSYRMLSAEARAVACSGRTSLCREVLNDEMVSCPSFNSEDSTFVASRKNTAEEALFRCEDERYELDLLIDGARSALQWFEAERLRRSRQPLPPTHRSLVQRIWGASASDVLRALGEAPSAAIPLVITRLLQKIEEWKGIFRALNAAQWVDVHERNVFRALDYQGSTIRTQDRKALSLRALTNEIQSVWMEQMRMAVRQNVSVRTLPSYDPGVLRGHHTRDDASMCKANGAMQLECSLGQAAVARTLLALLLRAPTAAENDRRRKAAVGQFLTMILPQLFVSGCKRMYMNEVLYHFFRLFQIAYCRLERLWELAGHISERDVLQAKHPLAPLFGRFEQCSDLQTGADSEHTKPDVKLDVQSDAKRMTVFSAVVRLIESVVVGTIDSGSFEEQLRALLGPSSYLFFTFDRLLSLIHKQVVAVLGDGVAERLISIFEAGGKGAWKRSVDVIDRFPLFVVEIESTVGGCAVQKCETEGIFLEGHCWTIRFGIVPEPVGLDENTSLPSIEGMERWATYVEKFVQPVYDASVLKHAPPLLLRRTLRAIKAKREPDVSYRMELRIDPRTLRMRFVPGTEDAVLVVHKCL